MQTASERIRQARILRTWASVCSAYPEATLVFQIVQTAQESHVSREAVVAALELIEQPPTDAQDYDHNRWNLH